MSNLIPLSKKDLMSIEDDIVKKQTSNNNALFFIDLSGSMGERITSTNKKKIDEVQEIVEQMNIKKYRIMGFAGGAGLLSESPYDEDTANIRQVFDHGRFGYSTYMHEAFQCAIDKNIECDTVVIISDGMTEMPEQVIKNALRYNKPVEIIFIGDSDDVDGADFMKKLSKKTGGTATIINTDDPEFSKKFLSKVETLLLGSGPAGTINL